MRQVPLLQAHLEVLLSMVLVTVLGAATAAGQVFEDYKLPLMPGETEDFAGTAVGVDGVWVIAGIPNHGYMSSKGIGAVVRLSSDGWEYAAEMRPLEWYQSLRFGEQVALDEGHLLIAEPWSKHEGLWSGRVTAYVHDGYGGWSLMQMVRPKVTGRKARFGESLAMHAGRFVASSRRLMGAHVFRFDGVEWVEEAQLLTGSGVEAAYTVAIHGGVAAIGEWTEERVVVFELGSGGWEASQVLVDPTPNYGDEFGRGLAVGDGLIVVGEPVECFGKEGEVFIFTRSGDGPGGWVLKDNLRASDGHGGGCGDDFGFSLDIQGDTILVGDPNAYRNGSNQYLGAGYLFERNTSLPGGGWEERVRFAASDQGKDGLGWSVALSESFAILGSPAAKGSDGIRSGAVYAYQLPLGTIVCEAAQNSTGLRAMIRAKGVKLAEENVFELIAEQMPSGTWGHFLVGRDAWDGAPPGGQGTLCIAGAVGRLAGAELLLADDGGRFRAQVDTTDMPPNVGQVVLPGEEWLFQGWFRDGSPYGGINFSDAIAVRFE